jgi:PAS domain S-box-containing protein
MNGVDPLLDTAPCGFVSFGDDGKILAVNATLLGWLGYSIGELRDRHMETLMPVATRIFYQTHFFPLLKLTGTVEEVYITLRAKTGEDLPMLTNAARREQTGVLMYDCVFMIVRQRSRYEDEILLAKRSAEEARVWLSTTLQSIGDAVIATDALGRVELLNPVAEDLTGWPQLQAAGRPLDEVFVILNEETRVPVENPVATVLKENRVVGLANHTLLVARDGTARPIDDSCAPIRSENGEIIGVVLVFRDVTERRRTEQELLENQLRIESLNQHLVRAMTETHHRVKNNLQVISALLDMQIEEGRETVNISELIRLSQHIRGLAAIHDLLTHQTKDGGKAEFLSIRDILDRLLPLLQGMSRGSKLKFEVVDVVVPISHATALAVLANELVSNATKHGKGDIGIVFRVEGDRATFEVWDEGEGFPPGFDPLTSANTGVELVQTISKFDLHGEVTFQNRPGRGAQVTVTFPLEQLGG